MMDSTELLRDVDLDNNEALRETLFSMRYQHRLLEDVNRKTMLLLSALASLLNVDATSSPFRRAFSALRRGIQFSHAMMMVVERAPITGEEYLLCIEAEREALIGTHWPIHRLFRKVLARHAVCTLSGHPFEEWKTAVKYGMSVDDSAMLVPVKTATTRGILMMVMEKNESGRRFDSSHITLARRYGLLVSNALVSYEATQSAEESQRLRELSERLRASEDIAQRNADLINEIVQSLPVGVSVQDDEGKLQVINTVAARLSRKSVEALKGQHPPGFDKRQFNNLLHAGTQTQEIETVVEGERRFLQITYKPVNIFKENLLLSTVQDITEYRRFEEQLRRNTFHDQLTGLPNRILVKEIVERMIHTNAEKRPFVFAVINIDGFKQINDYYSHTVGDNVLKFVAGGVLEILRETDTLARISGDEFLLILSLRSPSEATVRMEEALEVVRRPMIMDGQEIFISASIGAALYPVHGHDYESLGRAADNVLARIKTHHRGSFGFFDPTLDGMASDRMNLEQRLRAAVHEREPLRAAYQPKVTVTRNGKASVCGFEALARWVDAAGHVQPPAIFIELAGELGLLDDITLIILDHIAEDLPALKRIYGNDIRISFNVSAQQVGNQSFIEKLVKAIDDLGIASSLMLEITEDALVGAQQFQDLVLPKLRRSGVRVSIDDFGTGYSSLSMLADITADELKIDRAFITAIQDRSRSQSILKAIDSVCGALAITMVAEGVETREELDYLIHNTHINAIQGYFFGRPLFAEHWLSTPLDPNEVLNRKE